MDFVNLFDYLEPLKMIYLGVFYLGNLKENLIYKKLFWTLWQFCLRDSYYVFVTTSIFVNVFYEIIWKYTNVMSSLCFCLCALTFVITQLGVKVYVILVSWRPVCVTVIEFHLCDGDNEFRLCEDNWVPSMLWGRVPSLWRLVTWPWVGFYCFGVMI